MQNVKGCGHGLLPLSRHFQMPIAPKIFQGKPKFGFGPSGESHLLKDFNWTFIWVHMWNPLRPSHNLWHQVLDGISESFWIRPQLERKRHDWTCCWVKNNWKHVIERERERDIYNIYIYVVMSFKWWFYRTATTNEGRAGIFWERVFHCMKASLTSRSFSGLFPLFCWHRWNYVSLGPYTAVQAQSDSSRLSVASLRLLRNGPCAIWPSRPWISSRIRTNTGSVSWQLYEDILQNPGDISRFFWVSNI